MLLIISGLSAQKQIEPDARLIEAWGAETVKNYVENNQNALDYYNYYLDNAYYIEDFPQDKGAGYDDLPNLELKPAFAHENHDFSAADLSQFNVLKYDIKRSQTYRVTYRMGNSHKVITFYSGKELMDEYNMVRAFYSGIELMED